MGRRGDKAALVEAAREPSAAREALERAWRGRITWAPELAACVTAGGAGREPFHRWIPYAQGYSPELVRRCLRACGAKSNGLVLDPFSGSGTTVIECARRGVRAAGVEASPALAFLTTVIGEREFLPLPEIAEADEWTEVARRVELSLHRAALMLAVARRHTSSGKLNPQAPPLHRALQEVAAMMRDDLRTPLAAAHAVSAGDARRLDMIGAGCVSGVLTSPPYLSRHDYTRIVSPYETVYRFWNPMDDGQAGGRDRQVRATVVQPLRKGRSRPGARIGIAEDSEDVPHAAIAEVITVLRANGQARLGELVAAYFDDLRACLAECFRVCASGALLWFVIGGARLKGVYVPSDLLLAALAESAGFSVTEVQVARNLIDVGRKFGGLVNVAPRESVVMMRKS